MEAFHYRYHPLVDRVLEIIRDELGPLRRVETRMCIPLPSRKDIRFQLDLAGGAVMDTGCYAIHQARTLAGAEPEVLSARAKCVSPGVDRWLKADLQFPDDCTGSFECALWSGKLLSLGARVEGEHGTLKVLNLTGPQYFHRVVVQTTIPGLGAERNSARRVKGEHTYWYQLRTRVRGAVARRCAPYPRRRPARWRTCGVIDAACTGPRGPGTPPAVVTASDEPAKYPPIPAATVVLLSATNTAGRDLDAAQELEDRFRWHVGVPRRPDRPEDRAGARRRRRRGLGTRRARRPGEETGLAVDPATMVWLSHWRLPRSRTRRFATWFFVAPAPAGAVTIDGGEIHDSAWMRPGDALRPT